jgi:hypothetical protein
LLIISIHYIRADIDEGKLKENVFDDPKAAATQKNPNAPAGPFWIAFHSPEVRYDVPNIDESLYPDLAKVIMNMDANAFLPRPGRTLQDKYRKTRRLLSIAIDRYNRSGRHSGISFFRFSNGSALVQLAHYFCELNDFLGNAMSKRIVGAWNEEDPIYSDNHSSSVEMQKEKRKRLTGNSGNHMETMCQTVTSFLTVKSAKRSKKLSLSDDYTGIAERRMFELTKMISECPDAGPLLRTKTLLLQKLELLQDEMQIELSKVENKVEYGEESTSGEDTEDEEVV